MAPIPPRGSWECWLAGSNRVDLSPPASLRIRNPSFVRRRFPNLGRVARCASASSYPQTPEVVTYLTSRCVVHSPKTAFSPPVPESDFSNPASLRETIPCGKRLSLAISILRFQSTKEQDLILLSPCSPLWSGMHCCNPSWNDLAAAFSSPAVFRQSLQMPAQDCALRDFSSRLFTTQLLCNYLFL